MLIYEREMREKIIQYSNVIFLVYFCHHSNVYILHKRDILVGRDTKQLCSRIYTQN